jgi:hypothetical protein
METQPLSLPLKIVAIITSLGMTLSMLGIVCSYDKATLYFSMFSFICWFIGGLIAMLIYVMFFEK